MPALLTLPLLAPILLAGAAGVRPGTRVASAAAPLAALAALVCGLVLLRADREATALGVLRADALTALMLVIVGVVALTALGVSVRSRHRWYPVLVCLFLGAMCLAVLADNLGVTWVAIEATTITTALLVGQHHGTLPLEAAWKYVVLGSVGVAIAFLGVVILYATANAAGIPTLSWVELTRHASSLGEAGARFALVLATLGFATKAGLAPMHAWLPDAHSQAPAPVSGLMSGVLLSVALYVILRLRTLSDAVLGQQTMRTLLLTLGLASLAVAAVLMVTQRDYKRLLAYSSIEHMGIMAVAAGIGGSLATAALLAHMLGHGIAKAAMFVQAGRILRATGTSRVGGVSALLARDSSLGRPWLSGMAALAGFPPFPLFFTEVAILLAGWQAGLGAAMTAVVVLLFVAFTGLTRHSLAMTLGAPATVPTPEPDDTDRLAVTGATRGAAGPGTRRRVTRVTIALTVAASLVLVTPAAAPVLTAATSALDNHP